MAHEQVIDRIPSYYVPPAADEPFELTEEEVFFLLNDYYKLIWII